jgi:predicted RNA-binding protein with TRAM domain
MYQQKGRFNREDNGGGVAPVKVGDELDVKIEAVGEKGDGIAKKNGFVIFVPGAKEGSTVKIRITRVLKKMAFSEVAGEASLSSEAAQSSDDQTEKAPEEPEDDFSGEDSDNFGEGDDEKEEEKFE